MKNWKILIVGFILSVGCKKPYNPQVSDSPNSYLIVEGIININGATLIKLSRTVNLSSNVTTNPVVGAQVSIESSDNANYILTENESGHYYFNGTMDNRVKYRLRIKVPGNQEYLSDFVEAKITPSIDSIGFNIVDGNKVQIYANTHDPNNSTRYYRYDYVETWHFHAKYNSSYISNGSAVVIRTPAQDVYFCYANNISNAIVLGSSAKLKEDVLYQTPITAIESTSEKIEDRYSILLNQYALTEQANKFWTQLKKNTEQLGSIFDALPSEITGNIHNINNPEEPVIGYISACTVSSKRIFINNAQLLQNWLPGYPYDCELDTVKDVKELIGAAPLFIPVSKIDLPGVTFYLSSDITCVDCTLRGFKKQPDFWK